MTFKNAYFYTINYILSMKPKWSTFKPKNIIKPNLVKISNAKFDRINLILKSVFFLNITVGSNIKSEI